MENVRTGSDSDCVLSLCGERTHPVNRSGCQPLLRKEGSVGKNVVTGKSFQRRSPFREIVERSNSFICNNYVGCGTLWQFFQKNAGQRAKNVITSIKTVGCVSHAGLGQAETEN